jgi:hypothetical protein
MHRRHALALRPRPAAPLNRPDRTAGSGTGAPPTSFRKQVQSPAKEQIMAHDDRRGGGGPRQDARGPEWRGDEGFGGGWGNQVPRPHPSGDRDQYGPSDEPYGGSDWYGPAVTSQDYRYGGPGPDSAFGEGPRFGQAGAGRSAWPFAASSGFAYGAGARPFGGAGRDDALVHDPHYADWRHRKMAELDRDYDDYRREHQSRFDREFGEWRARRQEQRAALGQASAQMEVVGADGAHVGIVDCARGDRLVLTRSDESAGGVHHMIPCGWIDRVEDKVVLNLDAKEARRRWEETGSRALFERERGGARGPRVLNRSFAGTYPDDE